MKLIAFGPVPSRRLGASLGINNIPPKRCTYSCVYCQIGKTRHYQTERTEFYAPENIYSQVREKVEKTQEKGEGIDYLTFVPDGEPTLDINLGREIDLLRALGIKIAVITNSSLISRTDVRSDLLKADLVSFKVDAITDNVWKRINNPAEGLDLGEILRGIMDFRNEFRGTLITETMLVDGLNDREEELEKLAQFLVELNPHKVYLAVPTRPPAEKWVKPTSEDKLLALYRRISHSLGENRVELLCGFEGDHFISTHDPVSDLLSIISVHPMRDDALDKYLAEHGLSRDVLRKLIDEGKIVEIEFENHRFYLKKHPTGN